MKTETKWEIGNRMLILIAVLFYLALVLHLASNRPKRNPDVEQLTESVNAWVSGIGISNAVVAAHVAGWQAREQGWSKEKLIETVNEEIRKIVEEAKGE